MTIQTSSPTSDLRASLDLVEIKPGVKFSRQVLKDMLPDTEIALFFGKVYELDAKQLSKLLSIVSNSDVASALLNEGGTHSTDLQGYVVDILDDIPYVEEGDLSFDPDVPKGDFLPEVWKSLEVEVATSIKAVASKLEKVVNAMPGKQGSMVLKSMLVLNAKRPTIGDHKATVHHAPQKENLVVLDVSGSMNEQTVRRIVEDVVAMSYMTNAHMAIVSDDTHYWEPGTYGVQEILNAATYGGTHYETLRPLFDQDWGVVVTVADYDSSMSASHIVAQAKGRIDEVLDISLVNRPTYLAEVVGQLADRVRPLLVATGSRPSYLQY